jgi:16S rRNA (guanine966-N2)-methyltransferase
MVRKPSIRNKRGSIRIVGGIWKSQMIRFSGPADLRPTPDLVRETLFNWLAPTIQGTTCLDLFAGSGALGFEAASRGARLVDLVDYDRNTYQRLSSTRKQLSADQVHIYCDEALSFLTNCNRSYDLVFLDPPFDSNLATHAATMLQRVGALNKKSLVYLETAREDIQPILPVNWVLYREKTTGRVCYQLYRIGYNDT